MQFTNYIPDSWENLQDSVARYLNESGYDAITPKTIHTVRGDVEVDVFVKTTEPFLNCFICECKYWKSNVIQDIGASMGIMISTSGYQSGAVKAAHMSNVRLYTWDDFIKSIEYKWTELKIKQISIHFEPLMTFFDPLDIPKATLKSCMDNYRVLVKKYNWLYSEFINLDADFLVSESCVQKIICESIHFSDVESYLNYIDDMIIEAVEQYRLLFKSCLSYSDDKCGEYWYFYHYLYDYGDDSFTETVDLIRQILGNKKS